MKKIATTLLPLLLFLLLAFFLMMGLRHSSSRPSSAYIGKAAPDSLLPKKDFLGHVTLVNFFASWCRYCHLEHPILMDIAKSKQVRLIGVDYKDKKNRVNAWLKTYGNPYFIVIPDPDARIALDFGVYGTPETFIIDQKGIVRYRHVGPITREDWKNEFLPMIKKIKEA